MAMLNVLSDLPFVSIVDGRLKTMWSPQMSGSYVADNATGRRWADDCMLVIARQNNPALLSQIGRDMALSGALYTGIEVGFSHRIAEIMMRGFGRD